MTRSSPFTRRWNPYTAPDAPLHWRKPQTVKFVGDPFLMLDGHKSAPEWAKESADAAVDRIFATMALCQQHTFYVATERPGRMREYLGAESERQIGLDGRPYLTEELAKKYGPIVIDTMLGAKGRIFKAMTLGEGAVYEAWRAWRRTHNGDAFGPDGPMCWPLPNVVLGTVVRTQEDADTRIPELLECPAAYRYVGLEPREAIDLKQATSRCYTGGGVASIMAGYTKHPRIDWLHIAGGREPLDLAWIRSLIAQADAAGVPVWVESLGSKAYQEVITEWETHEGPDGGGVHPIAAENRLLPFRSRAGSDPSEWPSDIVRRERLEAAEGLLKEGTSD